MKTELLRLTNYKGLQNFELKPGPVTALIAGNGKGKTTIIDAFRSLAEGGSEPDSITIGEDESIIKWVVRIDEGDCQGVYPPGRYDITRTIKKDGYGLTVKNPKGVKIPKEKQFVEACLPKMAYDPIAFDRKTDEQRAEMLRDILKVPVAADQIRKAASLVDLGVIKEEKFADGIGAVDGFVEGLKKTASELRAAIKDRQGSINTFRASIEGKTAEDVSAKLAAAKNLLQKHILEMESAENNVASTFTHVVNDAKNQAERDHDGHREWHAAELAKLNEELAARRSATDKIYSDAKEMAQTAHDIAFGEKVLPLRDAVAADNTTIAALDVQAQDAAKLAGALQQVEAWETETREKADKLESIGVAVDQLGRLRTKLLAALPLDGMSIKGGKLYINDILSSEVNTAARMLKWVEIATQYANDGQLIIVDDLEHLEDASRKVFEEALRVAGIQLIATMVDPAGGPLRVEETLTPQS